MTDIYQDARLYDALGAQQFGGSDLSYWQQQCPRYGGPVLELACGSGRLTIPLAEQGVDIELSCAGFVIEEKYGGYDLSPFTTASQKQLIVAWAA